jgi:ubiquinone/menaquinone biosynthesis C-methylase UbiE
MILHHRQLEPEWMDEPGVSPEELRRGLRFIRRVNRYLGYTRATIHHLQRFSRRWPRGQTIRIVDLATGSGDIPLAILRWAQRERLDVRIVGVELHPTTALVAAETPHPRLSIVRGDARQLPFADGSFDYAMTSMFLHHLPEEQIVTVLREMDRVSRRGVVVADLIRNPRALAWITFFTALASPIIKHDARVSVRQAFTVDEFSSLARQAGLDYAQCHVQFGHRFVLAGEKV